MKNVAIIMFAMCTVIYAGSVPFAQETSCAGLYSVADALYKQGKWSAACQVGLQALAKAKSSGAPYESRAIKSMVLLADVKTDQGKAAEAQILCYAARGASTKRFGPNHPVTINTLIKLGDLARRRADDETAKQLYLRAVEAARGDHIDVASALVGLAGLYKKEGRPEPAEDLYRRALEVYEKTRKYRPYLDGNIAQICCDLAGINRERGDYAQASQDYRKALAKFEPADGANSVRSADTRVSLGDTYLDWGKPARAERQYRKALAAYESLKGSGDVKAAITLKRLGDLYLAKGNYPKAERSYTQATAVLKSCMPTCDDTLSAALKALADLKLKQVISEKKGPLHEAVLAILQ